MNEDFLLFILKFIYLFIYFSSNRIINKRIHVRVEHINPSRCREDFYARLKEIKAKRRAAHEEKRRIQVHK